MSLHWERQAIHNSWFLIPKRSQWFVLKFISVLCRGRAEFSSEFCHYDGAFWRKTSYPFCFDSHWLMHFKQRDTNICHNFKEGGRSTSVYLPGSYVCACNLNIASEWWYIRSYLLSTLFKKCLGPRVVVPVTWRKEHFLNGCFALGIQHIAWGVLHTPQPILLW